jgi:energy-coupling factor transporter transmembrane protein EcfT
MVGAMVAGRFETAGLCLLVAVAAGVAVGMKRPSSSWTWTLAIGISLAMILNLFLTPGRPLGGGWLGLHATAQGLSHGALLALRLLGATVALHGLRAAWPGERAADELARLARPLERLRVPVREARMLVALALRFAPLLASETRRIARLQELRAGRPPRGPGEWLDRRRAALIPTMVSTLERAERVALALEARHVRARPIPVAAGGAAGWRVVGLSLVGVALLWRG